MKYYEDDGWRYIVSDKKTIKGIYKAIKRHSEYVYPISSSDPKFSENREIYALCIDTEGWMYIVNSDTMLEMIVKGEVKEVSRIDL